MLPGHYVTLDRSRVFQVRRILNHALTGYHGMPVPAALYDLAPAEDRRGPSVYATIADSAEQARRLGTNPGPDLRMLPPCPACSAAAGFPCDESCQSGTTARATL